MVDARPMARVGSSVGRCRSCGRGGDESRSRSRSGRGRGRGRGCIEVVVEVEAWRGRGGIEVESRSRRRRGEVESNSSSRSCLVEVAVESMVCVRGGFGGVWGCGVVCAYKSGVGQEPKLQRIDGLTEEDGGGAGRCNRATPATAHRGLGGSSKPWKPSAARAEPRGDSRRQLTTGAKPERAAASRHSRPGGGGALTISRENFEVERGAQPDHWSGPGSAERPVDGGGGGRVVRCVGLYLVLPVCVEGAPLRTQGTPLRHGRPRPAQPSVMGGAGLGVSVC